MRFRFSKAKSESLRRNPKRGVGFEEAQEVFTRWYFPQAYKLTEHGKLLLMAPGKDRAGTLGFRCVVDAQ
jgi:hypothetical protein